MKQDCLAVQNPDLAAQWHPTLNGKLSPADVTAGCSKKVWWHCPAGDDHVWSATVNSRNRGAGCPFCANKRVSTTNSLQAIAPHVAAEWHASLNGELAPESVVATSTSAAWWQCAADADHVWSAQVRERVRGRGCPYCGNDRVSTTNSLAHRFPELAAQWHPELNGELLADNVVFGSNRQVWWRCPNGPDHTWRASVVSRTSGGNGCPFCSGNRASVTNSLASQRPELTAQLHPTLNGDLNPEDVVIGSHLKVWWQCPANAEHLWRAQVKARALTGQGCPYCAGTKVDRASSLAALHPELLAEWHPTRNGDLSPEDVACQSSRLVWWKCAAADDHEWRARPADRVNKRSGCPFCSNRQVSATNSLSGTFPDVAAQWHPSRNGLLLPSDVTYSAGRRVWWKCDRGPDHEWKAAVIARTVVGQGCPYCANKRVSVTNALSTTHPALAAEWHPTLNGDLAPTGVVAGSEKRVWWQCRTNPEHLWQTAVYSRAGAGQGCPFCSLLPESRQEVVLRFEIAAFLDVSTEDGKIQAGDKVLSVDIKCPSQHLALEFDGAYWHKDQAKRDSWKSRFLREHGWRVVRVREAPLEPLGPDDLVVPWNSPPKPLAIAVLQHLRDNCGIEISGLDDYAQSEGLANLEAAEAYIARRLADIQRDDAGGVDDQ